MTRRLDFIVDKDGSVHLSIDGEITEISQIGRQLKQISSKPTDSRPISSVHIAGSKSRPSQDDIKDYILSRPNFAFSFYDVSMKFAGRHIHARAEPTEFKNYERKVS